MNNVFKRLKSYSTAGAQAYKTMESILKVHPIRIIKFLPFILNQIFYSLCVSQENTPKCFYVLPELLASLSGHSPNDCKSLLRAYSDNYFNFFTTLPDKPDISKPIYLILTQQWLYYIRDTVFFSFPSPSPSPSLFSSSSLPIYNAPLFFLLFNLINTKKKGYGM